MLSRCPAPIMPCLRKRRYPGGRERARRLRRRAGSAGPGDRRGWFRCGEFGEVLPASLPARDYLCKSNRVSSIRLFILGTLAASGPLHGHQIRQQAQSDRTEQWADVQVGSVYGALKRLASEELIREVRTERVGNRPERTVYEITGEGRRALAAVRDQALRELARTNDPFDLALAQSRDLPEEVLTEIVANRLAGLRVLESSLRHRAETDGHLPQRGGAHGHAAPDRACGCGDPLAPGSPRRMPKIAADSARHRRPAPGDRWGGRVTARPGPDRRRPRRPQPPATAGGRSPSCWSARSWPCSTPRS